MYLRQCSEIVGGEVGRFVGSIIECVRVVEIEGDGSDTRAGPCYARNRDETLDDRHGWRVGVGVADVRPARAGARRRAELKRGLRNMMAAEWGGLDEDRLGLDSERG